MAFFRKEDLHVFFHLVFALKLSTAAVTFYLSISGRFLHRLSGGIAVLLSVSYALCQYNIAQGSNIMWLDGVYMLPLILLGVYRVATGGGSGLPMLSVGASLLFNWYTGAINCLFSAMWFCVECAGIWLAADRIGIRRLLRPGLRYTAAMVTGVLLSSVLFVPTLAALQRGRGGIDWQGLSLGITGEFPSVIQGFALGSRSALGSVSLYCGSYACIACIGCFVSGRFSKKEKAFCACLLFGVLLLFYWRPCSFLFSLLKNVGSYWYRYSYVGIFALLFLAAFFYAKYDVGCGAKYGAGAGMADTIGKSAGIFAAALLILQYVKPAQDVKRTYLTAAFAAAVSLAGALCAGCGNAEGRRALFCLTGILVCGELAADTALLMGIYHDEDVQEYRAYVEAGQRQIDGLLGMDGGSYRIAQTSTRNRTGNSLTGNYNEALAFGYWSVSSYTSDPDDGQRDFLTGSRSRRLART